MSKGRTRNAQPITGAMRCHPEPYPAKDLGQGKRAAPPSRDPSRRTAQDDGRRPRVQRRDGTRLASRSGTMKRMSTATHGIVDYVVGGALMIVPPMLNMSSKAKAILTASGAMAGAYSAMTDYERGMVRVLPMKGHLTLDALSGGMLLGSALLLDDEEPAVRTAMACIGLFEIAASLLTETEPRDRRRNSGGRRSGGRRKSVTRGAREMVGA